LRLYLEVGKRAFRRHSTYRAAAAAGVFTNTVFGIIFAYVMLAVYRQRPDVGGWDVRDALTFVFLTQGLIAVIGVFAGVGEIGERIKTGDIVTDLYRPVDFQLYWLAMDAGRSAYSVFARGVPPFAIGALLFDVRVPPPAMVPAAALSIAIAVVGCFAWRFIVGLWTFWLVDDRGPSQLSTIILMFFSGFILPIPFFPDWLRAVCRALPFVTMYQLPVEVFLDKHHGLDLAAVLAYQVLWAAVLLALGRLVLRSATRRVEVLGG
jgi:ABC-2 type transport system permease protein